MLVLNRRLHEEILINDDIRITINRIGEGRVTLGIDAPRDVRITRPDAKTGLKPEPQEDLR